MPSIAKPFVEVALNENFMGGTIYNENFPFGTLKPDSVLGRLSTNQAYKDFALWLNEATGGSAYRSGAIDLNPDVLSYMVSYLGGGALRFGVSKVAGTAGNLANGLETPDNQVPFYSRISGQVMPYEVQTKFFERYDAAYAADITPKEKDLRIKNQDRQMKKVIDRFNKRYEALIL